MIPDRERLLQLVDGLEDQPVLLLIDVVADRFLHGVPQADQPRGAGADSALDRRDGGLEPLPPRATVSPVQRRISTGASPATASQEAVGNRVDQQQNGLVFQPMLQESLAIRNHHHSGGVNRTGRLSCSSDPAGPNRARRSA